MVLIIGNIRFSELKQRLFDMVAFNGSSQGKEWKLAPCLIALFESANKFAPLRSQASDGTLGDSAHQARKSDHNPDSSGYVNAMDLTNDPQNGFDSWKIANNIAANVISGKEDRVKYLISGDPVNRPGVDLIFSATPWYQKPFLKPKNKWTVNGSGGTHVGHHLHVSCVADVRRMSDKVWELGGQSSPVTIPKGQQMFFARKSNSNTIWLVVPGGKVGMSTLTEFHATQKAVAGAGFNANVVIFPVDNDSNSGNFLDKLPVIG